MQTPSPSNHAPAKLKVRAGGELAERIEKNFDRLEREDYQPKETYIAADWPGDFPGRLIMALSYLVEVTDRQPQYLEQIVRDLHRQYNPGGYIGAQSEMFDEQQMSGHGWLIAGLVKHAEVFGRAQSLDEAVRMSESLFLPLRGKMGTYPRRLEERVVGGGQGGHIAATVGQWRLSTDIGCAFIGLQGLVPAAIKTGRQDFRDLIEEMFAIYAETDLVAISAQLHASLASAGMFLEYHRAFGAPEMLGVARRSYQLFRTWGITENYANYNWFRRPLWTEPCAIVDALLLALDLWQTTADSTYLDDAHHIYFNALGFAQKPHGGFGCDNCVGAQATYLEPRLFDPVGCCNMRGSVGLSRLVSNIYTMDGDTLTVGFYSDSRAEITFGDGRIVLQQETTYPLGGSTTLGFKEATVPGELTLRLFIPSWVDWEKLELKRNGQSCPAVVTSGFVQIRAQWQAGDQVELAFPLVLRKQGTLNSNMFMEVETYRHGPLILGVHESNAFGDRTDFREIAPGHYKSGSAHGIELKPFTDTFRLPDHVALRDRKRILFERH